MSMCVCVFWVVCIGGKEAPAGRDLCEILGDLREKESSRIFYTSMRNNRVSGQRKEKGEGEGKEKNEEIEMGKREKRRWRKGDGGGGGIQLIRSAL